MTYLLTISYHNQKVAEATYQRLKDSMVNEPCKVLLLDNNCPLMEDKTYLKTLCERFGFEYHNAGTNLGLHNGYNFLMKHVGEDCDRVILYDGDSYPVSKDWHIALAKVHDDPRVVWSSLHNPTSFREMDERGYSKAVIEGFNVTIPKTAVINSISCFKKSWLDAVGGFTEPHKYYGGLEMAMYTKMPPGKLWVFLTDYRELPHPIASDPVYSAYKVAHAHKGIDITFEEFLDKEGYKYASSFVHTRESLRVMEEVAKRVPTFHHHAYILLDIANSIKKDKINYLEIGCYLGASAALVMHNPKVDCFIVDAGEVISKKQVVTNLATVHPGRPFTYVQGNSHSPVTLTQLKAKVQSVDILFIDGDHSFAGVIQDFNMYSPMVLPGGYIVFDDYSDSRYSPDVKPAVDSILANLKGYKVIGCPENSFNAKVSYPMKANNCFVIQKIN